MSYERLAWQFQRWLALPPADNKKLMMDTSWADGLRGIASLFVVASHLVLCFARSVILPCCPAGTKTPMLWQLPPFRLISMGHSWVAVFFILLGFVNALKPLKLARQGQPSAALVNLATSAFRRTFRLMLPATAATLISWILCQFGLYESARNGDAFWLYTYTPWPSQSWGWALYDLSWSLKGTWMFQGVNWYDQPQWALIYLLQGSMLVFTALLMTVNLKAVWRTVCLLIFIVWSLDWSWELRDPLVGATIFAGILLAELSLSPYPTLLMRFSPIITPICITLGLLFMSLPSDYTDQARWSDILHKWGAAHFPASAQMELHRTWGSMGALLLVLGLLLSPHCRRFLAAKPFVWLGKVSFPIYLLHGIFVRSVLAWLAFQRTPREFKTDKGNVLRYPQRSEPAIYFAIAVSMGLMLVASHFWTLKVEPWFGRFTKMAEEATIANRARPEAVGNGSMLLPTQKISQS